MTEAMLATISSELSVSISQVKAAWKLLAEGASIPFIARYRKEATGSLDEVALSTIRERAEQLKQLEQRRESILNSLEERELLSAELQQNISSAQTLSELEDLYLPYRPKRRTKAMIAREKGLEPLARLLFEQNPSRNPAACAQDFVTAEIPDTKAALQGARDIIAEWISEDQQARDELRELSKHRALLRTKLHKDKAEEGSKYRDYFNWIEPLHKVPSHRLLAILRAEDEGVLVVSMRPEEEVALYRLKKLFVKGQHTSAAEVELALKDSYRRLLAPSIETETRQQAKITADTEAITVFTDNLQQLLLAPPLGAKRVMAIDPGFRTGCKTVVLDKAGQLINHVTIYPHSGKNKALEASETLTAFLKQHPVDVIAIGNGTASRETERFLEGLNLDMPLVIVSENGASVYSASDVAREEFPDYDVTVRGAVSIGRRLMDPLAELVKIDPKSIGVGQYQHDVDQGKLKRSLDDTVMHCVNRVGVNANTASKQLLTYVSGLGPALAQNIVAYRHEYGAFQSRQELLRVPRLGKKAFEQCAGFIRISHSTNPLDASAVHPESYHVVEKMAQDAGVSVQVLMDKTQVRSAITLKHYISPTIGLPTLQDIMQELEKPGRDPRASFEIFKFSDVVSTLTDLKEGMVLPGIVTNITNFGAFVDVGVHQDGLVHLSELAERFIKHPSEVVNLQQQVKVKVLMVDLERRRIALSIKQV